MTIFVRSRVGVGACTYTEWMEKAYSWRRAWAIVDGCFADRRDCRKWQTVGGDWFLDIERRRGDEQTDHRATGAGN